MEESGFKLCIEGPGADKAAEEISNLIMTEFGQRPVRSASDSQKKLARIRPGMLALDSPLEGG